MAFSFGLAQRYNWSGTPLPGQSPAAAHLSLSGCGPGPHLFSKLCLGDQSKETKIYYRIVYFYDFKCFRLVLKSKGNARFFFQILFGIRMGGGLAGGGAKTWQTEIYYRIVYFDCFKFVRLVSRGNARLFLNYVWGTRLSRPKYITGLFIFTIWNAFDYDWKEKETPAFFKFC